MKLYRYPILFLLFFLIVPLSYTQTLPELLNQGTEAFNQGDYVTAAYYLNRVREHDAWNEYSGKTDIYAKLAYIEESQGHFEEAAAHYRQAIRYTPETDKPNPNRVTYYYQTRYASTLVRSGYYETANKIYWELFDTAELHDKTQLLQLIINNYAYQDVTIQQMDHLHEQAAALDLTHLGWGLADLYRIQGDYRKSRDIYTQIWKQNIPMAMEHALSMVEVYEQTETLDQLLEETKNLLLAAPQFMQFYIMLLEYQNQSESALTELETYFKTVLQTNDLSNAAILAGKVHNQLLETWIELTENERGLETAVVRVEQILSANPMNMNWRIALANLYIKQKQQSQAVSLWMDWFHNPQANAIQQLNAVEQIHKLGEHEQAARLFTSLESTIPVSLKHIEAKSALELGLYEQAISSFQISSISANINAAGISSMILNYAGTTSDSKPLLSALIMAASGNTYAETPAWLRSTLIEGGVKQGMQTELEEFVKQDDSGVWRIQLAQAAQQFGNPRWAQSLLEAVPQESTLRQSAEKQYIELISGNPSIPSQKKAAELLRPSVAMILGITETIELTPPQIQSLFQYMEYCLNAYEPGQALSAVQTIESSTQYNHAMMIPLEIDQLKLNRARALSQLASLEPALELLHTIENQPYRSKAQLLKARIYLALKNIEEADPILRTLIVDRSDWQLANNALSYIMAMEPLFGESLSQFYTLQIYLLQGRYEEAFPALRSMAVEFYETDTEEWARYQTGELKAQMGDWESAVDEWKRLLLDVDHPVYHAMIRYQFTNLPEEARHLVQGSMHYEELVTEFPNTLFSDLARIEAEERLKGLHP